MKNIKGKISFQKGRADSRPTAQIKIELENLNGCWGAPPTGVFQSNKLFSRLLMKEEVV